MLWLSHLNWNTGSQQPRLPACRATLLHLFALIPSVWLLPLHSQVPVVSCQGERSQRAREHPPPASARLRHNSAAPRHTLMFSQLRVESDRNTKTQLRASTNGRTACIFCRRLCLLIGHRCSFRASTKRVREDTIPLESGFKRAADYEYPIRAVHTGYESSFSRTSC